LEEKYAVELGEGRPRPRCGKGIFFLEHGIREHSVMEAGDLEAGRAGYGRRQRPALGRSASTMEVRGIDDDRAGYVGALACIVE
jgi:hypothetical protein